MQGKLKDAVEVTIVNCVEVQGVVEKGIDCFRFIQLCHLLIPSQVNTQEEGIYYKTNCFFIVSFHRTESEGI